MTKPIGRIQPRVLVVEDENDLREAMVTFLNLDGFLTDGVGSLAGAERQLQTGSYEVLVLDFGLPDGDGLTWLASRTDLLDKGLVITTARGENADRLAGVRAGADVYLVKPVPLEELSSTISNLVRRLRPKADGSWKVGRLNWRLQAPSGSVLKLTHSEAVLMLQLANKPGVPLQRNELIVALGYDPDFYDPRRMEILVRRLRSKCEDTFGIPLPVETVHGMGYAFVAPISIV